MNFFLGENNKKYLNYDIKQFNQIKDGEKFQNDSLNFNLKNLK